MTDDDKISYGLAPINLLIDSDIYANGCYADTEETVSVMVKWNPSPYPNVYRYVVYVYEGEPSWYTGNILYRVRSGSELTTQMQQTFRNAYEVMSPTCKCTIPNLTIGKTYYLTVQAIADQRDGFLSDVYMIRMVADYDRETPKIITVKPRYRDLDDYQFDVRWSRFAGSNGDHYALYVWTGNQSWYKGDGWYDVLHDEELARNMHYSAALIRDIPLDTLEYKVEKISDESPYFFGVEVYSPNEPDNTIVANVYIVKCETLTTWRWIPRGEITQSIDWGTNVIDFETGIKHYQQKYTQPVRTFTATFSGLAKQWYEMRDFIDAHCGNLLPFYLWIDEYDRKTRYVVRLAESKYNPKFQTEVGSDTSYSGLARHTHIGFNIELTFIVAKDYDQLVLHDAHQKHNDTVPADDTSSEEDNEEIELGIVVLYNDAHPEADLPRPFRRYNDEISLN